MLRQRHADAIDEVLRQPSVFLNAPEILDLETLSAVRRLEPAGEVSRARAEEAVRDSLSILVEIHPLRPHAERVWSLRRGGQYQLVAIR